MDEDGVALHAIIKRQMGAGGSPKVGNYVGKFWNRSRRRQQIAAEVEGNHGDYAVTLWVKEGVLDSACSCYIGKHGSCHHCIALGLTFLAEPESFTVIEEKERSTVTDLDSLQAYLNGITLDELLEQMRAKGITQKAFCEAVGMGSRHLSAVKSSELKNRRFHELGAIKVAVLWVLENL